MVPYLKGFHLAIEMWRGGRDLGGWKLKNLVEEEDDTISVVSVSILGSLDFTRVAAHGLDVEQSVTMDLTRPNTSNNVVAAKKLEKRGSLSKLMHLNRVSLHQYLG